MSASRRSESFARTARHTWVRALAVASLAAVAACAEQDAPTAPSAAKGSSPAQSSTPSFVFVSDASGTPQLWSYVNGSVGRLSFSDATDADPSSAAGRIAFSSTRDGDADIYLGTTTLGGLKQLTTDEGEDVEPALDPTGDRIAFVSTRSGTPRLWTMDSTGANQVALETGSESFTPERSPAWSPSGTRIAFSSVRSGTSQIWIVDAQGGSATQLSHEVGGAFDPAWSPDGSRLYFMSTSSTPKVRVIDMTTLAVNDYASSDVALGQPACSASLCLLVRGAYTAPGDIVIPGKRGALSTVVATSADEHSPAILVP